MQRQLKDMGTHHVSTVIEKEYTTKFWSHFLPALRDDVDNED